MNPRGPRASDGLTSVGPKATAIWRPNVIAWAAGLVVLASTSTVPARADEPLFGYVYTTDLQPQGRWEFEQWMTGRLGKSRGDYQRYDLREEIEYGVTNDFQLALYANTSYTTAKRDGVDGATSGPGVPENADPNSRYSRFRYESASLEAIYRVLSPYKDGVGLAFYFEPSIGPRVRELEYKAIVQKNFLDDQLVWAANLTFEQEWERETGDPSLPAEDSESRARWDKASAVEFTTGLSYRFAPNWFSGVEFRNHNEFQQIWAAKPEHSAFFLGPNLHYASEHFWATLTVLPQLPLAQAYNADQRSVLVGGRIYGDEHEALEVRLRSGWVF